MAAFWRYRTLSGRSDGVLDFTASDRAGWRSGPRKHSRCRTPKSNLGRHARAKVLGKKEAPKHASERPGAGHPSRVWQAKYLGPSKHSRRRFGFPGFYGNAGWGKTCLEMDTPGWNLEIFLYVNTSAARPTQTPDRKA